VGDLSSSIVESLFMPIIETILIIGGLAAAVAFWPWILSYFTESIIPWVRANVSEEMATVITEVIVFADKGICPVLGFSKSTLNKFMKTILGTETHIEKIDSSTAKQTNTVFIQTEAGKVIQQVTEKVIPYENIPESIRSEMLIQNKLAGELDIKNEFLKRVKEQAEKQGILQTLTA
jgi:hypothetical protein